MQRIWAAAVMAAVVAALCVFGMLAFNQYNKRINALLNEAYSQIENGDFEKAKEMSEKIEKEWTKAENSLSFYMERTRLFDIGADIARLPVLAQEKEVAEFKALCRSLMAQLKHIEYAENG
ncbi:MAG: DUF4363 family protein [Oscillospiraceae bacterium]|jgi:hypothetical protein|nr:DUF4363 family protein [Oscillospiraceae bacterium]